MRGDARKNDPIDKEQQRQKSTVTTTTNQGETLVPGQYAEAMVRFTPAAAGPLAFIKLADGRGWVPVLKKDDSIR